MTVPPASSTETAITLPGRRLSRAEQNEQKRQLLLAAAWQVLAERGYHDMSLEEVAQRAGFTRRPIYTWFGSKDQLALALCEQFAGSNLAMIERIPPEHTLAATLVRYADLCSEWEAGSEFRVQTELVSALVARSLHDVDVRATLAAMLERSEARFLAWLRRCSDATKGAFRIPAEDVAAIAVSAMAGLFQMGATGAAFARPELKRDMLLAFVCAEPGVGTAAGS